MIQNFHGTYGAEGNLKRQKSKSENCAFFNAQKWNLFPQCWRKSSVLWTFSCVPTLLQVNTMYAQTSFVWTWICWFVLVVKRPIKFVMQQRRLHRKQRRKHFHTGDNIIIWRRTVRIFGNFYNSWQLLLWRTSLGIFGSASHSMESTSSLASWKTSLQTLTFSMQSRLLN